MTRNEYHVVKDVKRVKNLDIWLNMIVRNEEKTIRRCLDALKGILRGVVIADTGSTDDTVAVIEAFQRETPNVETHIVRHEWVNFGVNRNRAWEALLSFVPVKDRPRSAALLLDADMVLQIADMEQWQTCIESAFARPVVVMMSQRNGAVQYANIRMVRLDVEMTCKGATHEYYNILTKDVPKMQMPASTAMINDRGDGGCKADKFERDKRLLQQTLAIDATDARAWFYLGNTQRDLGNTEAAVRAYQERIRLGGWKEEVYLSWLYMGDAYWQSTAQTKDPAEPTKDAWFAWMQATMVLPHRPEAWYRMCKCARENKAYDLSSLFLRHLKNVLTGYSTQDVLFAEMQISEYLMDMEEAIVSFYIGKKEAGRQACRLLQDKGRRKMLADNILQWAKTTEEKFYSSA